MHTWSFTGRTYLILMCRSKMTCWAAKRSCLSVVTVALSSDALGELGYNEIYNISNSLSVINQQPPSSVFVKYKSVLFNKN